ncbi:insulin receptor substrate 2-like [Gadus macrocephalus]|uniref:insulin receptor substrate 2-like n=1 Tax=Gadus macrocephalus TaxID=80720 RepID=UPI0028CB1E29|nr:insulin receptor substrate 2-like [Gadus macrocephalus]
MTTTHAAVVEMSKAAEACGCCSPTPVPSAPTASPDRSGPIWDKVSLVSTSPAHDGALCVGPPAARYSGTGGLTAVGVAAGDHDVVKRGYMGKAERHHRRYFVLSAGSPTRPALLEWYDTEERFKEMENHPAAAGKALFGCHKRRVINLRCCLGVSKVSSTSKGHTVALYAKDYTLVMVAEDTGQQEDWYWAVKRLIEEERRYEDNAEERGEGEDEGGERLDDEDDGYCTLTSGVFKEVWLVTVKPRGLGRTKSLAGETRLCLSADSLVLVRGSAAGWPRLPGVTLPLLSVRRYGHRDGMFFLELGRSAPYGPGEVWMEAVDQADLSQAQQVHEAVREAVRALRVLPDFRLSPGASDTQTPRVRGGACSRDKVGREVPRAAPPRHALPAAAAETVQSQLASGACPCNGGSPGGSSDGSSPCLRSHLSSAHQASGYMEMAVEAVSMATVSCGTYMTMSPQGTRHTPHGEDYVAMVSPRPPPPWTDLSTCMSAVKINRCSPDDHQSYPPTFCTGRHDGSFPPFRRREPADPSQSELLNLSRHPSRGEEEEPTCRPASRPVRADLDRCALGRYMMSSCMPSCLRHEEDE